MAASATASASASASASAVRGMAVPRSSRWIPKRGQVLKRVLKSIFACVCLDQTATTPNKNPSSVFPY
ncbi:hypothetical protein C1H46_040115 [Malus baccata]|uniref:Uncharacterized protein n=1 Tax=Malus baccata TaxID=106549 RepID=A0A540KJJ4_MALBA|nr:hypothetical protein C1H46_040115 [Malus baccata]